MAQKDVNPRWHAYVAVTTAVIAVLAAIATFQASSNSSLMLDEKNNAILFQSQANKQWNAYLADDIVRRSQKTSVTSEQKQFQKNAEELENKVSEASNKFQTYFNRNSHFVMAGTFLEIAIALSAMSTLVQRRAFWLFSLVIASGGLYYLLIALL